MSVTKRSLSNRNNAASFNDIFGSPFHPLSIVPSWLTRNVVQLATASYHERSPDGRVDNALLAVLADALEEAGCSDQVIMAHLKSGGDHWRGCHVIDAILGKA